jgi:hypothetical protein
MMKTKTWTGLLSAAILITVSQLSLADLDGDEGSEYGESSARGGYSFFLMGGRDVAPVNNQLYSDECGACHFAYPPGLLPERSWKKIMGSLNDHFGDNAELPADTVAQIQDYLVKNAGDHSNYRRSVQMVRSIPRGETPLRISKVPFFVREHREIARKVKGNDKVNSMSNCETCHRTAAKGSFDEDQVNIPGIGRWED